MLRVFHEPLRTTRTAASHSAQYLYRRPAPSTAHSRNAGDEWNTSTPSHLFSKAVTMRVPDDSGPATQSFITAGTVADATPGFS